MLAWIDRLAASLPVRQAWRELRHALLGDGVKLDFDLVWLERHAAILYPILAVGTVALVALGFLTAWRSDELSGIVKVEYKREVIALLRREIGGLPVAAIARHLKLAERKTARLVEELQRDGILAGEKRQGSTVWRLRGLRGD